MATQTLPETEMIESKPADTKYVYFFGGGKADGNGKMKDVLGGKGAGLAEMTNAGLPVPPGFTIQTEACREYMRHNAVSKEVDSQMDTALRSLETLQGQKLGKGDNPLLVSVRSGAKFSMPGMMDTILNLGLNDQSVEALAKRSNNPRFAYDSYRRLIQMFGNVVLEIKKEEFEHVFEAKKKQKKAELDTDLDAKALNEVITEYKKVVKKHTKPDFPQDPHEQLVMARDAVFRSWNNDRAKTYRRINNISDDLGTAVNVQAMVFGNLGESSGTGVGFTRNPATGVKEFYGEFLMNAQGEDVVAGIRTPVHISELQKIMPDVYSQLREITDRLEKHYRDVQDFEFTIQEGKLYMLQTRNGKRTGIAAVKVALEMVEEGLITQEEAIFRVEPDQLYHFLVPRVDEKSVKVEDVLTNGLPASPGATVGQIVFTADEAVEKAGHGAKKNPVILVRAETTPEDIHGMEVAEGILTSRGGMTSHAAVVTRGMGKCCVVGAGDVVVDEENGLFRAGKSVVREGQVITLNGATGEVIVGPLPLVDPKLSEEFKQLLDWARDVATTKVRANADTPEDARKAREFEADGIGLVRTEHMFFKDERIPIVREMIMAEDVGARKKAVDRLLPFQREDFIGIFKAMAPHPVTIRLLDPPLHEFLPKYKDVIEEYTRLDALRINPARHQELGFIKARLEALLEANPMLGHRGCRLGITFPEIYEMQVRAIMEAACTVARQGVVVEPEIMIPLTGTTAEMKLTEKMTRKVAEAVTAEMGVRVAYMIGTMIETPRAALIADQIARHAEFFSFGTNDLTQMTYGYSRDDIGKFLPFYLDKKLLPADPFAVLDREGVGELIRIGIERGRKTNPGLKIGICGEHGGEPSSVEFCHQVGMTYVSCSSYMVPIAWLAAAQAEIREPRPHRARG